MRNHALALVSLFPLAAPALAETPGTIVDALDARQVIASSIAYHDPGGVWWKRPITISLTQPRAEGPPRQTRFTLHPDYARFDMAMALEGDRAEASRDRDTCSASFNGGTWNAAAEKRFGKLDCARLRRWQDYYAYLFNTPMNLLDAGGTLDPRVRRRRFLGREVLQVRIDYGEGQPVWFHFFDPETFATIGCSFSKDGEEKDGEYIAYEDEVVAAAGAARLPRKRSWYMHADGKHLGDDIVDALSVGP